jgi:riboflavin transporter FmnP
LLGSWPAAERIRTKGETHVLKVGQAQAEDRSRVGKVANRNQVGGQRWAARTLIRIGMLGAVAFALMYAEFNLPFFPSFLQYDPGDVPTLVGGFAMGPLAGAAVALVKGTIFFLSGKDEAGLLGTSANMAMSLTFVIVAAAVYFRTHNRRGAVLGLGAGALAAVAVMTFLNYFVFLPAYGLPPAAIGPALKMTVFFNLVKGTLNSVLTFILYKKVSPLLHG